MKVVKEIVATTGKYTDHKGAEKNRYQRVGTLMERDDGSQCIKIDALPVGDWSGWANLFDPKPKEAASAPARHPDAPIDDEVPF